jgi:hypothetical protein
VPQVPLKMLCRLQAVSESLTRRSGQGFTHVTTSTLGISLDVDRHFLTNKSNILTTALSKQNSLYPTNPTSELQAQLPNELRRS